MKTKTKSNLTKIPISCYDGHDFEMAGDGYYKSASNGDRIPNIVYRMVFCSKCGTNLEIIVMDRRPTEKLTRKRK